MSLRLLLTLPVRTSLRQGMRLSSSGIKLASINPNNSGSLTSCRVSFRGFRVSTSNNVIAKQAIERLENPDQAVYEGGDKHGHGKHWAIERYLAIAMLPLIPAGVIWPDIPGISYVLGTALVLHGYWGLMGVTQDYLSFRGVSKFKAIRAGIFLMSSLGLAGLFYFNYTDVGICHALRAIWTL